MKIENGVDEEQQSGIERKNERRLEVEEEDLEKKASNIGDLIEGSSSANNGERCLVLLSGSSSSSTSSSSSSASSSSNKVISSSEVDGLNHQNFIEPVVEATASRTTIETQNEEKDEVDTSSKDLSCEDDEVDEDEDGEDPYTTSSTEAIVVENTTDKTSFLFVAAEATALTNETASCFRVETTMINEEATTTTGTAKAENKTEEDEMHLFRRDYLKERELKAVDEFLRVQNWSSSDAKCWNIAVKFLMARKFDVDRAVKLYAEHDHLRKREGLDLINLNDDEFTRDLETGKFTILPFIKNYPVCALFTVRLHNGSSSSQNELTTLKTLIYQLDAALENPDAQRNGINFIYDMNNCKRSNYDLTLSQKILTLVRGSYPARLNKLFVVAAPFWFKCVVKVLSILMREKLRERVLFVSNEELKNQVPPEILPDYLGGHVKLNHKAWLIECNKLVTNKASTCSYYYHYSSSSKSSSSLPSNSDKTSTSMTTTTTTTTTLTSVSLAVSNGDETLLNTNRKRQQSSDFIDLDSNENGKKSSKKQISTTASPATADMQENGGINAQFILEKIEPLPFHNFYQSIHNVDLDDINGLTIDQLLQHVISTGAIGLSEEFKVIRSQPIMSSYEAFKHRENLYKNRYRDVICLDESRVLLKKEENGTELDEFDSDYIHANFVDGYKQKNAYISTQGPLDETVEDFWRMIWQQSVLVIAMTTKCYEQRKLKCAQYWPLEKGERMPIGDSFEITNLHVSDLEDYRVTKLELRHVATNKTRTISHCQFMSWPDHGVPKSAAQILDFIGLVRANQAERLRELAQPWQGHPLGPPVCVHCSAGIGRTGTFCAIEISVNRLKDMRTVNILDTVNKIRAQRAQSVQMRDQYVFCYLAVIEYAQREKLLSDDNSKIDLSCLFESLF